MNKKLAALVFAVFGAFMVEVSAAGVAEFHTAKGQDCAACHADGNLQVQMFRKRLVKNVTVKSLQAKL